MDEALLGYMVWMQWVNDHSDYRIFSNKSEIHCFPMNKKGT